MTALENPLAGWDSFFVIVGSSGAALIGLQFVVITLIAEMRPRMGIGSIGAFGTPTVVHLGGALVVSAVMSAPWPSLGAAAVALTLCGLAGITYGAVVIQRARRQTTYKPVWQDWIWHLILPCAVYAGLALAALFLRSATRTALFVVGGAALALLLIGIHNAWDTVTYIVLTRTGSEERPTPPR